MGLLNNDPNIKIGNNLTPDITPTPLTSKAYFIFKNIFGKHGQYFQPIDSTITLCGFPAPPIQ